MAKNLQELRKEAGFKSAKEFAAALEIPHSTYARYESQPESIPMSAAWKIADYLDTSIDLVVGREEITVADMRGDVQKFYDDLSPINQALFVDYMDYLSHREELAAQDRKREDRIKYLKIAMGHEKQFEESREATGEIEKLELLSPEQRRKAFHGYLIAKSHSNRRPTIDELVAMKKETALTQALPIEQEDGEWIMMHKGDEGFDEALEKDLEDYEKELREKFHRLDKEHIDKIMEAYDILHPEQERRVEYAVISLDDM